MPPRDTAETVQHWTDKYWVDFDAYNSGRTEELPRLFRSIFSSARRFLYVSCSRYPLCGHSPMSQ